MKYQCPLIVVKDIERSRHLFETVLEQKVIADYGENLSFEGPFAIHLKEHFSSLIDDKEIVSGNNNFELCFEHDNLEMVEVEIKKLGLKFLHEIQEQPWKQKVMRFYDYDHNLIEIGESLEHTAYRLYQQNYSIEDICEYTYMDEDSVKKAIQSF